MTLEEAKKKIKAQANAQWEEFKKTGSSLHQGFALGGEDALEILDEVDAEPVGNPEQLTLKELARELRKVFRFRCLTVSEDWPLPTIIMWGGKVEYDGRGWNMIAPKSYYGSFNVSALCSNLDLSEYTDENGNIDYSKCIVEVE